MIILKHIDQIAREKQRDVLYLEFNPKPSKDDIWGNDNGRYEFENDPVRQTILNYLTQIGASWTCCYPLAEDNNIMIEGCYNGGIYIDVPYDKSSPIYQKIETYLEYPDGSMKFSNVRFF